MKAVVTDDPFTYKPVIDRLVLERQVCVVNARKNVARRPRMVKGWQEWKSRLRSLMCHKRLRGVCDANCDTNNVTERVIGRSKIMYKTI